ncbi:MAG: DUF1232 domain-containing protein [Gemmatimonadota bacterium]
MPLPDDIRELLRNLPHFLRLLVGLLGDARVSRGDKALLTAAIVYTITPLDLLPDFIPLVGLLDDLYFVALAVDRLVKHTDPQVLRAHWDGPEETLESLCQNVDRLSRFLPASVRRRLSRSVESR